MTNKLTDLSLEDFCKELSSSSPAPGGGSTGALAAALASSLVSMVANLTIGKKKYHEVEKQMKMIKDEANRLTKSLLILVDKDTKAFNKVMEAFKMPKSTQDEKKLRSKAIQHAMMGACEVPLEIARYSVKIASISNKVAINGNKNAITDAGVAARLAEASYFAGVYNVRINLASIKNDDYIEKTNKILNELKVELLELVNPVYEICSDI
ncbi:MAG: cyclodeaminase/cyclohydrolase family protein [Clostridia bacterium]